MFSRLLLLLALPALPLVHAAAPPELRVLHRLFHPSLPAQPFLERATLHLTGSGPAAAASLVPSETYAHDVHQLALTAAAEGLNDALYQVALEHPGDPDEGSWATSSVPACHMRARTAEAFTLHLDADGTPFGLDFFVAPVPHDGACPKPARARSGSGPAAPSVNANATVTVALRGPAFPPLPSLRVPPPVTAEGRPVEPVREKSFLEKYWVYVVIALLCMMLAPAPAEEEAGGRK